MPSSESGETGREMSMNFSNKHLFNTVEILNMPYNLARWYTGLANSGVSQENWRHVVATLMKNTEGKTSNHMSDWAEYRLEQEPVATAEGLLDSRNRNGPKEMT
jgi:hypothetical protein